MNISAALSASALPPSPDVNAGILAGLFDDTTTSYKYFFFLALLNRIEKAGMGFFPDLDRPIPLDDLMIDMILGAWYPHGFCRLSLGSRDMLQKAVDSVEWGPIRASWIQAGSDEWLRLRKICSEQSETRGLATYVPFRLIRPFFSAETRSLADHKVNAVVAALAENLFLERKPLYCFTDDRRGVILNHDWIDYIDRNAAILGGWIRFKLAGYLQARNPSIPGIVEKLQPPLNRASMLKQQHWWQKALALLDDKARCIYTGQRLSAENFSLDHYLPWSFVAHDRLWNLIPTFRGVNSAKSDCLPAARYFDSMIDIQHRSLVAMSASMPESAWAKAVEPWIVDMNIEKRSLLDREKLSAAYESTLRPLQTIAEHQGFVSGWEYR